MLSCFILANKNSFILLHLLCYKFLPPYVLILSFVCMGGQMSESDFRIGLSV